ncbi:hypothetical protein BKH46_09255 [Helicobacter sp. 12S02634-8]|nr:hypothetical protein BKH46_09255 [Helicobacter sp. 12S02634-8]
MSPSFNTTQGRAKTALQSEVFAFLHFAFACSGKGVLRGFRGCKAQVSPFSPLMRKQKKYLIFILSKLVLIQKLFYFLSKKGFNHP